METVLIIAAHPDDEVLGCGGTIAKFTEQGIHVHVGFMAVGVFSRNTDEPVQLEVLHRRRDAAMKACQILGVNTISFGDFPDNRMDTLARLEVIKSVERLIVKCKPDTVMTHHAGDVNIDHSLVHHAVVTACRPQRGHPVKQILSFEVASSTEWQLPGSGQPFVPNWFIDISSTLNRKLLALEAYDVELRDWPHPRSKEGVEHLARWRGATIGVDAAEAFVLGRKIS